MHIVDKNYIALFDHGIKMLVTYQLYILDPRFVPRLLRTKKASSFGFGTKHENLHTWTVSYSKWICFPKLS